MPFGVFQRGRKSLPRSAPATASEPRLSYEFGPFRLDTASRTLLHDGSRVPFSSRAFDALHTLIENRGQVVDRSVLMRQVWPDTVVEENSLAQCIVSIRKTLGNDYVATVPGRGYSFTAPVRLCAASPIGRDRVPFRSILAFGLVAPAAVAIWWLWPRAAAPQARLVPLTGSPRETRPSFSPDGQRIVYEWIAPGQRRASLYIKLIGAGDPMPLTPGRYGASPAWSPDGRQIAYVGDPPGIYLVPAMGGAERKLTGAANLDPGGGSISWFPDGKRLAIKDIDPATGYPSVFEISVDSGERRQLTRGVSGAGDFGPAVSPDGRTLGFVRVLALGAQVVYLMPLGGGEPRQLTGFEERSTSFAWTADSREIVYSASPDGMNSLWRVSVSGGTPQRISVGGYYAMGPRMAPAGDRLAFTQRKTTSNLWRVPLDGSGSAVEIAKTTRQQSNPQFSPDGRKLAFCSTRSGWNEEWISDPDGSNLRQVTSMVDRSGTAGTPKWSPDGTEIAFAGGPAGTADIYVANIHKGAAQPLVSHSAEDILPSYSRDGRWVYFASNRTGAFEIWKAARSGGEAVQVTHDGGMEAIEDPGGRYVYYLNPRKLGIWRLPTAGNAEPQVVATPAGVRAERWRSYSRRWTVAATGAVYFCEWDASTPSPWRLVRLNPDTGEAALVVRLPRGVSSLTVAPDGRVCVYARGETETESILLIENFR
jgi:Tol biopolymer transport system component/DNA-binding winged helix-turn-helix (wHTH) protein